MAGHADDVGAFYDRHPISEARVRAALRARGKDAPGAARPEDLWELDQDHYGGVAAVAMLAHRAGVGPDSRVLDVCAGLAGPARFVASRLGARVTAVELNGSRAAGARRLTELVGLGRRVAVVRADAQALPFRGHAFTAVLSQEGLLHVPDKARALAECARVLVPGGRLAVSDWVATARLGDGERRRLGEWMAAVGLERLDGYRALLGRAGFVGVEVEDCTAEWIAVVRGRMALFRALRAPTAARLGEAVTAEYEQLFAFFVDLLEAGKLGGGRFSATAAR
jgi:SAM-dependent methyltransferase